MSFRLLLVIAFLVCSLDSARGFEADFLAIEEILTWSEFELQDVRDVRFDGDRNKRAWFVTPSGQRIDVKVQRINSMREDYNENPRYGAVTYQLQKLFLEAEDYVVPTVVLRSQPLEVARTWDAQAVEVSRGTGAALYLIQAWVPEANPMEPEIDSERIAADAAFARAWANLNVLTHLIRHNDSNKGNVLIVDEEANPRIEVDPSSRTV